MSASSNIQRRIYYIIIVNYNILYKINRSKVKVLKTRVIQKQDVGKEQWDKFVIESPYGWAFHLYDVISVDRYKEDKDISFAIYDDDKDEIALLSMLHIEYKEDGAVLHSRYGLVLKGGGNAA